MAQNRLTAFLKNLLHSFLMRPLFLVFLCSVFSTVVLLIVFLFLFGASTGDLFLSALFCLLIGFFFIYPIFLTIANAVFIPFCRAADLSSAPAEKKLELVTILFGAFLSFFHIYFQLSDIIFVDRTIPLYGKELHFPIAKFAIPTLAVIAAVAAAAYFLLRFIPPHKIPSIVTIVCIAAICLGIAECAVWIVQIFRFDFYIFLLILFPLNCILIGIRTILEVSQQRKRIGTSAKNWPFAALGASLLLLGLLIGILALCGQPAGSIVKAWTDTADWNLSRHAAGSIAFLFFL